MGVKLDGHIFGCVLPGEKKLIAAKIGKPQHYKSYISKLNVK